MYILYSTIECELEYIFLLYFSIVNYDSWMVLLLLVFIVVVFNFLLLLRVDHEYLGTSSFWDQIPAWGRWKTQS